MDCFTSGGVFLESGATEVSCLGTTSFFGEICGDGLGTMSFFGEIGGDGLLATDAGIAEAVFDLGCGDDGTGVSSPPRALCI